MIHKTYINTYSIILIMYQSIYIQNHDINSIKTLFLCIFFKRKRESPKRKPHFLSLIKIIFDGYVFSGLLCGFWRTEEGIQPNGEVNNCNLLTKISVKITFSCNAVQNRYKTTDIYISFTVKNYAYKRNIFKDL